MARVHIRTPPRKQMTCPVFVLTASALLVLARAQHTTASSGYEGNNLLEHFPTQRRELMGGGGGGGGGRNNGGGRNGVRVRAEAKAACESKSRTLKTGHNINERNRHSCKFENIELNV